MYKDYYMLAHQALYHSKVTHQHASLHEIILLPRTCAICK